MALTDNKTKIQQLLDGINALPEAGSDPVLQEKTVSPSTSSQSVTPDDGYDGLSQVTVNAMSTATQATPSITVSSAGLITASATQSAGYVASGTKSATKQLTTQAAKTITPSTSSQTAVAKNVYTTGAVTVAGDANLVAANIAEGVSIFGVTGTHAGGGSGGGAVETCSVSFFTYGGFTAGNGMLSVEVVSDDGTRGYVTHEAIAANTTIIVENVICGSRVYARANNGIDSTFTVSGVRSLDHSYGTGHLFEITASTGETATIMYHPM